MRKIFTIAILLFSSLSFAQNKIVETLQINKLEISSGSKILNLNAEDSRIKEIISKNEDLNYVNFYKKKSYEITENPLNNIKLVLPNNFNWLLRSIV